MKDATFVCISFKKRALNDDVCTSCPGVPTFVATRQNLWFSSAMASSYPWQYEIHRIGLDKGEIMREMSTTFISYVLHAIRVSKMDSVPLQRKIDADGMDQMSCFWQCLPKTCD